MLTLQPTQLMLLTAITTQIIKSKKQANKLKGLSSMGKSFFKRFIRTKDIIVKQSSSED